MNLDMMKLGYVPNQNAVEYYRAKYKPEFLSLGIAKGGTGKNIFFYRLMKKYFEEVLGIKYTQFFQRNGTCVGQGVSKCCIILQAIDYFLHGRVKQSRASAGLIYALSRVEVGRNPGRWDGSNGSWAAEALVKYGIPTLEDLGLSDHEMYADERNGVSFAASRAGVPDNIESKIGEVKAVKTVVCEDFEMSYTMATRGYPTYICSNLIPTGRRDSRGASPLARRGGHCVAISAYVVEDGYPRALYDNSWGPHEEEGKVTDSKWSSGPLYEDQPEGTVYVYEKEFNRLCESGDCHIILDNEYGEDKFRDAGALML